MITTKQRSHGQAFSALKSTLLTAGFTFALGTGISHGAETWPVEEAGAAAAGFSEGCIRSNSRRSTATG